MLLRAVPHALLDAAVTVFWLGCFIAFTAYVLSQAPRDREGEQEQQEEPREPGEEPLEIPLAA